MGETTKNFVPNSRIEVIEPLRGFAAIAVAWFHFTNGGSLLKDGWLKSSGSHGWVGVEVFFVISGFVIPYSMYRGGFKFPRDIGTFLIKRVLRLDPPYLIGIGLSLGLLYISASLPGFRGLAPQVTWPQVLAHLGYANSFLGYNWLNPVFWTLAIEFQFYVLAAFIFPIICHPRRWLRVLGVMCLGLGGYLVSNSAFVLHFGSLFALGILTFQMYRGMIPRVGYLFLVGLLSYVSLSLLGALVTVVSICTSLLIAFVRLRRYPILAFFGAISYSVYLVHVPIGGRVVNLGARYSLSTPLELLVLSTAVGVTILTGYLMYRYVERPAQRWSSAIRYAKDGRSAGVSAVSTSIA